MRWVVYLLLSFLPVLPLQADTELPDEFYQARPNMQLYMAYAEFKMANYDQARAMWLELDGRGSGEAAFNLGILYEQGLGVSRDLEQALAYYLRAAELGSRAGAYQIGLMHLNHPDQVSVEQAKHWLTIAALDGDLDAAMLLKSLDAGEASEDPMLSIRQLLAEGKHREALGELMKLSRAEPPNYEAITRLAWLYETGLGVEQDIQRAGQLFKIAAEGGNAEAQYSLAVMYQTGVGQMADTSMASYWLERSAGQGYQPAQERLQEIP